MRSWWGEGASFRIALVEAVDIRPAVVDIHPAVFGAIVVVACAGPLLGSRLFDNAPLYWGQLLCRVP